MREREVLQLQMKAQKGNMEGGRDAVSLSLIHQPDQCEFSGFVTTNPLLFLLPMSTFQKH